MIATIEKQCTGCGCCEAVCPIKCIKMVSRKDGFLYPEIDIVRCVNCDKCRIVCPVNAKVERKDIPEAYAFYSKDNTCQINSSSGGAFATIAYSVLEQGGIVYGAAFDEGFNIVHMRCTDTRSIVALFGSKYTQSFIGNAYSEVKTDLHNNKTVLFSGTPCQVEGLLNYLSKEYTNLITVDFVCHGVPSPIIWKDYLTYMKLSHPDGIKRVSFRDKALGWENFSMLIAFNDGNEYRKIHRDDPYMKAFLANLSLRESCYDCQFKGLSRRSDITMADYWHVKTSHPELYHRDGVSVLIVHSKVGRKIIEAIQDGGMTAKIPLNDCISDRINTAAIKSVPMNQSRNYFFAEYTSERCIELLKKHTKTSARVRMHRFLSKLKKMIKI